MSPVTSTTLEPKTMPTYRMRTMAGDIDAIKKGGIPAHIPVNIEIPKTPNVRQSMPPAAKMEQPTKTNTPLEKIKLSFPKIDTEKKKENPPIYNSVTPFSQPLNNPKPLTPKIPQPFNSPISKPVPSLAPKMQAPMPPLDLPTAPKPPPIPQTKPLTPPPVRLNVPMPPPAPSRPAPLPPLPTSKPSLPPLPALPKNPQKIKEGGSKGKLIGLIVLGVGIFTFIIGEVWWFFLRSTPTPQTAQSTQEILPPPQELQPLLPVQESSTSTPQSESPATNESDLPSMLLTYDRTEAINADKNTSLSLGSAISSFDSSIIAPDELVRLIVKANISTTDENSVTPTPSELPSLDTIIKALKLRIPLSIRQNLGEKFDLFMFGANTFDQDECAKIKKAPANCSGPRLGLAIEILDPTKIPSLLKAWEKTMAIDLKPLILAKTGAGTAFQTGTYQGQNIRYKNMPTKTITIEYTLANDVLIITTSKSSMLKAIDSVPTVTGNTP